MNMQYHTGDCRHTILQLIKWSFDCLGCLATTNNVYEACAIFTQIRNRYVSSRGCMGNTLYSPLHAGEMEACWPPDLRRFYRDL